MMELQRDFDAKRLNAIVNHPDVRRAIALDDSELDLTDIAKDERNFVWLHESGLGGTVFQFVEPGVYELHTQFRPEVRRFAKTFVTLALERLFLFTDAMELFTRVPDSNVAALRFTQSFSPVLQGIVPALGPGGQPGQTSIFRMTIWDWTLTPGVRPLLEDVAEGAGLPADPFVGATLRMLFSPALAKGMALYARYARVSGFPPLAVLNLNPPQYMVGTQLIEGLV